MNETTDNPAGLGPGATNTGHGHVWERPDGVKARCGGPGICRACSADAAKLAGQAVEATDEQVQTYRDAFDLASNGAYISATGCIRAGLTAVLATLTPVDQTSPSARRASLWHDLTEASDDAGRVNRGDARDIALAHLEALEARVDRQAARLPSPPSAGEAREGMVSVPIDALREVLDYEAVKMHNPCDHRWVCISKGGAPRLQAALDAVTRPVPVSPPLPKPVPGEIWQDAEGTLMVAATGGEWWCFGVEGQVAADSDKVAHPLALVFDKAGEFVGDRLHYPAWVLAAASPTPVPAAEPERLVVHRSATATGPDGVARYVTGREGRA